MPQTGKTCSCKFTVFSVRWPYTRVVNYFRNNILQHEIQQKPSWS